jgi:NAD(P)-dependent dehydrogenase (short-subunit alcohol dehydrogenase family)
MQPDDDTPITRREVLGQLATGAAAAALAGVVTDSAAAQQSVAGGRAPQMAAQAAIRNPVDQYPRPPFPRQEQPWPGLASRMNPKPDHGETSYHGSGRMTGRRALITGGDSGIGRAVAIAFAREGADVAINYLPVEESDAQDVVRLIRAAGRKAVPVPGDIRDERFCNQLVDDAVRGLGGLDVLVHVAGRQQARQSIAELTTELFDWTVKTNLYALFWITKAAMPHLGPGASIITTASQQAYDPQPYLLDYAPTKAAIVTFTKVLAKQVAPQGIRVNSVAPGPFWTPLQVTGGRPLDQLPQFGSETPYGRPGQPVEIAPIYVMLASAESSYASGQVIGESGGHGNP